MLFHRKKSVNPPFAITAITCAITEILLVTYCKPIIYPFSDSSDSKNQQKHSYRFEITGASDSGSQRNTPL
jgi:hypothetical protein